MEFNITGAPQTANANQQVAEFWAQAERLRMALLAIKPEAARAINRIAFLSEFSDIIDVALRAPDPQPVTDSLEVQEAVALPATAEREALNRIARIGVHRGMDCDEAVERLIAAVGYARQALLGTVTTGEYEND